MTANMSTAAMATEPAPYQQHAYKRSATFTPIDSGMTTPTNVSPTSPRSATLPIHNHAPQIRRPKNPIYVPAALRRTELPSRQSPPKVDSAMDTPNGSWGSGPGCGPVAGDGSASVPMIATEDLNTIYNDMPLTPVAGPITRNHWAPDSSANVCSASACHSPFGFFNRRHHCRKCGGIFCWQHSQRQVKLNEDALFHPEGELQRACDRCYTQFRKWEHMRSSRQNSESSGSTGAVQIETPIAAKRPDNQRVGSIANSFSGAWNWSTF